MNKHGRDVEAIETWVRKGLAEGWCRRINRVDANGAPVDLDRYTRPRRYFVANLSMDCESPKVVEIWGRYNRRSEQTKPIFVDVHTRCRKCEACLSRKAKYWTGRAFDEFNAAPATYMITLTVEPELHYQFDARMQQPLYRGSTLIRDKVGPLNGLAPATIFRLRAREIGYEVTDYLKRIRKRAKFRYLLVAERHMKNPESPVYGRPHFHVLLHELKDGSLVHPNEWQLEPGPCEADCKYGTSRLVHKKPGTVHDHAFVRTQWAHGFTTVVRCVDVKSAIYVCKYVSKDPMARVRASIGYGKTTTDHAMSVSNSLSSRPSERLDPQAEALIVED